MAVYGVEKSLSKAKGLISPRTELKPTSLYGESKYLAERRLTELESESFRVAIVRPPNVYGPGCRGGYISTYASIVSKLPAIPKAFTSVKQSVLYIDNLSRFIYLLIRGQKRGVYTPQDEVSVSAVDIMSAISEGVGLNKKASAFLGLFIYPLSFLPLVRKGYGGVSYDQNSSHHEELDYLIVPYNEGIKRTVLYGTQRDHSHL
jgi:UDP-glucose 4-epimerase